MEQKLTAKQNNILQSLRELTMQQGEKPTSYRLHKYLVSQGMKESMKSVMQVIESLEKKELITRDENKKIFLVENENYGDAQNIFSIPLYGLASCGEALAYADDGADDFLQLSKSLFQRPEPEKLFAVKALGDSMNKEGISDGDYVIFEKAEGRNDFEGKIVVAVINGMATIKRYKNVGKGIIGLFPHSTNFTHHPIYLSQDDVIFIAGIFKKVLPVKFVSL
ncbi:MAG: S24 family peptidase [Candidatus Moranbacteria bacterium]|nr:S24 family peptidase [Candidatus Moranbacteria bacterium]